jgi:hypothetical protein
VIDLELQTLPPISPSLFCSPRERDRERKERGGAPSEEKKEEIKFATPLIPHSGNLFIFSLEISHLVSCNEGLGHLDSCGDRNGLNLECK